MEPNFRGLLDRELRSLVARIAEWPPARFGARADLDSVAFAPHRSDRSFDPATRADVLDALVGLLADLGRRAGSGAPPGLAPTTVELHALAEQLKVMANDLLDCPDVDDVAAEALAVVLQARTAIDGSAPPRDAATALGVG
jgi:hypothetical protein